MDGLSMTVIVKSIPSWGKKLKTQKLPTEKHFMVKNIFSPFFGGANEPAVRSEMMKAVLGKTDMKWKKRGKESAIERVLEDDTK
jgi:hypothetical protein